VALDAAPGKARRGLVPLPAVIQGQDGTIHVIYSYFVEGGKSMKHAGFNAAWVAAGDPATAGAEAGENSAAERV